MRTEIFKMFRIIAGGFVALISFLLLILGIYENFARPMAFISFGSIVAMAVYVLLLIGALLYLKKQISLSGESKKMAFSQKQLMLIAVELILIIIICFTLFMQSLELVEIGQNFFIFIVLLLINTIALSASFLNRKH